MAIPVNETTVRQEMLASLTDRVKVEVMIDEKLEISEKGQEEVRKKVVQRIKGLTEAVFSPDSAGRELSPADPDRLKQFKVHFLTEAEFKKQYPEAEKPAYFSTKNGVIYLSLKPKQVVLGKQFLHDLDHESIHSLSAKPKDSKTGSNGGSGPALEMPFLSERQNQGIGIFEAITELAALDRGMPADRKQFIKEVSSFNPNYLTLLSFIISLTKDMEQLLKKALREGFTLEGISVAELRTEFYDCVISGNSDKFDKLMLIYKELKIEAVRRLKGGPSVSKEKAISTAIEAIGTFSVDIKHWSFGKNNLLRISRALGFRQAYAEGVKQLTVGDDLADDSWEERAIFLADELRPQEKESKE